MRLPKSGWCAFVIPVGFGLVACLTYLAIVVPVGLLTLGGGRQIDLLGAGAWSLIDICWKCLMFVMLIAAGVSLYLNRFLMGIGILLVLAPMAFVQMVASKWVVEVTLKSELRVFEEVGVERIRDDTRQVINNMQFTRPGARVILSKDDLPESIRRISDNSTVQASDRMLRYATGGYGSVRMGYIIVPTGSDYEPHNCRLIVESIKYNSTLLFQGKGLRRDSLLERVNAARASDGLPPMSQTDSIFHAEGLALIRLERQADSLANARIILDVDRPPCVGCLRQGGNVSDGSLVDVVKAMDIEELVVRCENGFDGISGATEVVVKKSGEITVVQ